MSTGDLVKRSLQLISGGAQSYAKSYGDNAQALIADAEFVRSVVSKTAKSSIDQLRKLKSKETYRGILGWFNQKSDEVSGGMDDGEFDAGFHIDASDDDSRESTEHSTVDTLNTNTDKQLNAMFSIGGKQAETSMANTAEIVTTFNNRSSEMIGAINGINKSLSTITGKLDTLIDLYSKTQVFQAGNKQTASNGLVDYNGTLSLQSIVNAAGNPMDNSLAVSMGKMFFNVLRGGSPEDAMGLLFSMVLDNKKVPGGKGVTFNQLGTKINDTIGAVTQNLLQGLIDSAGFKQLFGDVNRTAGDRDYSKFVNNRYNTKPALFDGMTRQTIVDIIPGYLKEIAKSLSGKELNIGAKGILSTGRPVNRFAESTKNSFSGTPLEAETVSGIREIARATDVTMSDADVTTAVQALTMAYVMYLHRNGYRSLMQKQISTRDVNIMNRAVNSLTYATGKSAAYWTPICMAVVQRLTSNPIDGHTFCKNVNASLNHMVADAMEVARTTSTLGQVGKLTQDMADDQFKQEYQGRYGIKDRQVSGTVGGTSRTSYNTTDYMHSIFSILNRGINVRNTGSNPYKNFRLRHANTTSDTAVTPGASKTITGTDSKLGDTSTGGGYLKSMLSGVLPDRLRLNMQFFGHALGITDPTNPDNPDTIANKTKQIMSPLGNIRDKIIGVRTTDDGIASRQGGILQAARDRIKSGAGRVGDDLRGMMDRKLAEQEYKSLQSSVKNMSTIDNDTARDDQLKAQQIFSMLQAAVADGDGRADLNAINSVIVTISDPNLKARISSSVNQMITNTKPVAVNNQKSPIGKIIAAVGIGAKKILSPITKIFRAMFSVIKGIGSKVGKLIGRGLKSGAEDIRSGVSNMARGFFGQKELVDADGNVTREGSAGVIGRLFVKPLKAITDWTKKSIKAVMDVTVKFYKTVGGLVSKGLSSIGGIAKKAFGKLSDAFKNPFGKSKKSGSNNALFGSDFVKGFSSVFQETKARKEKSRIKKLDVETVADRETSEISDILNGKKKSWFGNTVDKITDLLSDVRDKISPDMNDTTPKTETAEPITETPTAGPSTSAESGGGKSDTGVGDVADAAKSVAGGKGKKPGIGFDIGKIVGGFSSALLGIGKIILTVVTSLEGFKALTELIESVFKDGLQPLNKVFYSIIKTIKPIVKIVTQMVTVIAEAIGTIAETLIDVISPIIEAIQPILETIFGLLEPILDMITGLVEVILAPLMGVIQSVIVPILRHVGNVLSITLGVLEVGMGIILTALGGILVGIGSILKILPGGNDKIAESGKSMLTTGTNMVSSGINSITTGVRNEIKLATDVITGNPSGEEKEEDSAKITTATPVTQSSGGSVMDGLVSAPGTDTTNMDAYGSGDTAYNQNSYGSYKNMRNRGCGPVALADAYSRRTGSKINPAKIADRMGSSYDQSRGTSVGSMVNTSRSMGMNVAVGGVTASSLKQASGNNPITVLGSGEAFGTRRGNNHYMNVVGTDHSGGAYVMNPLNGAVSRHSISSVVNGSKLGMYGSGDSEDTYSFDDNVTEAMSKLTDITGKVLGLFTGDSKSDQMQQMVDAEAEKEAELQARLELNQNKTGKQFDDYEDAAREEFKKDNPKRDGESDEDYEKRFQKVRSKYIVKVSAADRTTAKTDRIQSSLDGANSATTSIKNVGASVSQASDSMGSTTTIAGDNGTNLGANGFQSNYAEPQLAPADGENSKYRKSALHEFFTAMGGDDFYTLNGGFWKHRNNQNQYGVGSSGDTHAGIDFNTPNDASGTVPIVAPVSGTVTDARGSSAYNGGWGNTIAWEDAAGNVHRVAHMHDPVLNFHNGQQVTAGESVLGHIGNTGSSYGAHLHYQIEAKNVDKSAIPVDSNDYMIKGNLVYANPFTYFKPQSTVNGSTGIPLTGANDVETIWNYCKAKGLTDEATAGLMANWQAESGFRANNLQNTYETKLGMDDAGYTSAVDSGAYDIDTFANDSAGYGLAQWTYNARKRNMHNFIKNSGRSIGDLGAQLDFAFSEIESPSQYPGLYDLLRQEGAYDVPKITSNLLKGYENPADQSASVVNYRVKLGQELYSRYHGSGDMDDQFIDVPPIQSDTMDTPTYANDTERQSTVVNNYVVRPRTKDSDDRLNKILSNTYRVSAERVESLLEEILDEMRNEKESSKKARPAKQKPEQLFPENGVPSKVARLFV